MTPTAPDAERRAAAAAPHVVAQSPDRATWPDRRSPLHSGDLRSGGVARSGNRATAVIARTTMTPTALDAERRSAAAALGLPPSADAAAARAAFLRGLPGHGFVPPPDVLAAVRHFTGRPACEDGCAPPADAAPDAGLRTEVEAFAMQF